MYTKNLDPAKFDEKDISCYLFEDLFDFNNYCENGCILGFIEGTPVMIEKGWHGSNMLSVRILNGNDPNDIIGRFKEFEDEFLLTFNVDGDHLFVSFYFYPEG